MVHRSLFGRARRSINTAFLKGAACFANTERLLFHFVRIFIFLAAQQTAPRLRANDPIHGQPMGPLIRSDGTLRSGAEHAIRSESAAIISLSNQ